MRIVTDRDRCLGAGQCALHAPEIFDQSDEDGTVVLRTDTPPDDQHEVVRLAARMCPNQVITLYEDTASKAAGADAASPAAQDVPFP
jgi:ferredoxin